MNIVEYAMTEEDIRQNEEIRGKFIQLIWLGEEYLIFAPAHACTYHVEILTRFLDDRNIPYKRLKEDRILVQDSLLNVMGGGRFSLREKAGSLELSDNSQAFGRFDDKNLPEKIANAGHRWSTLALTIHS